MNTLIKIYILKNKIRIKTPYLQILKKSIKANMEIFYEKFQTIINRRSSAKQARAL